LFLSLINCCAEAMKVDAAVIIVINNLFLTIMFFVK